jgi:Fe-S-cluster containining protein
MDDEKQLKRLGRRTLQVYRELDPIAQKTATTMKATCSKGCAHCCYLLSLISLPEAVAIAERLLTRPEWQTQYSHLLRILYEHVNVLANPDLSGASYFAAKIPCVFLGTDKTCRIYDVRPTSCRYHYVISDPKHCSPDAEDLDKRASIDSLPYTLKVLEDNLHVSKQVGIPMAVAPMQVMVLWALKLLSEGRKAFNAALEDQTLGALGLSYWMARLTEDSPLMREAQERMRAREQAQDALTNG